MATNSVLRPDGTPCITFCTPESSSSSFFHDDETMIQYTIWPMNWPSLLQRAHIRVPRAQRRRGAADGGQPVRDQVGQLLLRGRRARHAQQGGLQLQRRPQVMTTTTTKDGPTK